MRRLLFLILISPMCCVAQTGTPIFSVNNGLISTNNQFVDTLDPNLTSLNYSLNNPVQIQVGNAVYAIKTGRFSGWSDESGDYDIIEFSRDGQQKLLFREGEGILKYRNSKYTYPSSSFGNYRFSSYATNDYFIEVVLNPSSKALIFLGPSYGTDLPRLMIFVLTETDVKLVYYKKVDIHSITVASNSFSMMVNSNLVGDQNETPILHTIWLNEEKLYFKNN